MSEIEKVIDANAVRNVVTAEEESPIEGTTQSVGDPEQPVDQDALDEQTLASDGVEQAGDEAEDASEYADTPDPIANAVQPSQSMWGGFFGRP